MTTSAITPNSAAALAAQSDAAHAARTRSEQRKPPIEPLRDPQASSRYAERQAARDEGRGRKLDTDA